MAIVFTEQPTPELTACLHTRLDNFTRTESDLRTRFSDLLDAIAHFPESAHLTRDKMEDCEGMIEQCGMMGVSLDEFLSVLGDGGFIEDVLVKIGKRRESIREIKEEMQVWMDENEMRECEV